MNVLSGPEVLARLNAAIQYGGGEPITRQVFEASIRPLMASPERGEAQRVGSGARVSWAYDPRGLWQWEQYLAVRAALIRRGEWSSKRPYAVRDLEDIALLDAHADVWDALLAQERERADHEPAP